MSSSKKSLHKLRKSVMHGENIMFIEESSSDSSAGNPINYITSYYLPQEHAKPRIKGLQKTSVSRSTVLNMEPPDIASNTSISSSLNRFRGDFETFKCKTRVFGESLNLCRCMAYDFRNRLEKMEKRLENLERRQKLFKKSSNYSVIIQKNKLLSYKTKKDVQKLQTCSSEEEMKEIAGRICRNYLHGVWKTIDPKELHCKRISGGLSNFLFYVALPDDPAKWGTYQKREGSPENADSTENFESRTCRFPSIEEPKKVLLRIYGQVHGERAMDAIVTESVIFTLLSERRLGPKLHGVFSGGRIEEYIPARCLLTKELADPSLSMKIAEKMAAIHSMEVPLNKEPNWIWKTMYKWLKVVKEECLTGITQGKNETENRIIKQLKGTDFDVELEWLKKFLAAVESPVVFCHNDMQEGNILLVEDDGHAANAEDDNVSAIYVRSFEEIEDEHKTADDKEHCDYDDTCDTVLSHISDWGEPKLVLIDFEYCAYNHRGFDIANHFQEWAFDYTNPEYPFYHENQDFTPSLEQKEIFIREYLKHFQSNAQGAAEVSLDDVNKLLDEVDAFACASHLFWTLWSIVNASKSQIPFGYWEYGFARLTTYYNLKQEAIKKDKHGLPQKRKICEVDI